MNMTPSLWLGFVATIAFLTGAVPEVSAQVWETNGSSSWNYTSNWNPATVPDSTTAVVTIGGGTGGVDFTSAATVNVIATVTANTLAIDSAQPFTLAAGSLTFGGSATTPLSLSGYGAKTIATGLAFNTAGARYINVGNSGDNTVNGIVSGSASIAKSGVGTLTFTGNNTFTGNLYIDVGTVVINSLADSGVSSAAGKGAIIRLGGGSVSGTVLYTGPVASTNRRLQIGTASGTAGGEVGNDGTGELTFTAPLPIIAQSTTANRTLTLRGANNGTIQGGLANNTGGTIGLSKDGLGRWTLSGNNTYTGATTVNNGSLHVSGAIAGSAVTVNGGILSGGGTVGPLTVAGGGMLAPGGTASVGSGPGTLNAGVTTFGGRGRFRWEINDATGTAGATSGWDQLAITGALNITATPAHKFRIHLASLAGNVAGLAVNFAASGTYSFPFVTATGGIMGFDPTVFELDPGGLQNELGGTWSIEQSVNSLLLTYTGNVPLTALHVDTFSQQMDDIQADMRSNEARLRNVTSGAIWATRSMITMGRAARGDATPAAWKPGNAAFKSSTPWNAIAPWFVICQGVNNAATNVRVKISDIFVYVLKRSTNTWEKITPDPGNPIWAADWDFLAPPYTKGPVVGRTEPGDKLSYKLNADYSLHGSTGRFAIDGADVAAVFAQMKTELVLDNPLGPDDRASAQILVSLGVDYYPNMTITTTDPNYAPTTPAAGGSRFGLVGTAPRTHYFATIDPPGATTTDSYYVTNLGGVLTIPVAQFESNPPPNLTLREVTFFSVEAGDGWVLESTATSGLGGSRNASGTGDQALRAGDSATKQQYKSILSFDTSTLPANAVILGATLELRRGYNPVSSDAINSLGALLADVRTGHFGTSDTLENTDFEAAPTLSNVVSDFNIPLTYGEWAAGSLNQDACNAINRSGVGAKTQFRVYFANGDNNNSSADYLGFYSGEYSDPGSRPVLWVGYNLVTFTSVGADDGWVLESSEDSNTGGSHGQGTGAQALRVGDSSAKQQYKTILSFDTSSIPDSATVTSVTLKLKRGYGTGTNPFTDHGPCYADIKLGLFNDQALLEDADFQADETTSWVTTMSNPVNDGDWSSGSLNTAGRNAINKTGKTQLRVWFSLGDNNNTIADYIGFYSGSSDMPDNRPVLEVTYQ